MGSRRDHPTPTTVTSALADAEQTLGECGLRTARGDALALVATTLGVTVETVRAGPERLLGAGEIATLRDLVERRTKREPLPYLTGTCRFCSLELYVDHRVLVPHPFSATLVEIAVAEPAGANVHDVGTGCGAIALAIAAERGDLAVSGSDISADAIDVARGNAQRLGLAVSFSVAAGLPSGKHYDLVVANLPYQSASRGAFPHAPEHDYLPEVAVFGGDDGLDLIRALLGAAPAGQRVALQHAESQAQAVGQLLSQAQPIEGPDPMTFFTAGVVP